MTLVEVLGSTGWKSAGSYKPERANQLAELLRLGGAIVRVEGESPIRGRIHWSFEPAHAAWVGRLDGIELFAIVMHHRDTTLYPNLPGYKTPKACNGAPEAQSMAELILDQFIMRIGVRGVQLNAGGSVDTVEMKALPG